MGLVAAVAHGMSAGPIGTASTF